MIVLMVLRNCCQAGDCKVCEDRGHEYGRPVRIVQLVTAIPSKAKIVMRKWQKWSPCILEATEANMADACLLEKTRAFVRKEVSYWLSTDLNTDSCTSGLGDGNLYYCRALDCPVHGERNRKDPFFWTR